METMCELSGNIERQIVGSTHGRVRDLEIQLSEEWVVLRGVAATYYAKQLAQHAALEVAAGRGLINNIRVGRYD